MKIIVLGGFGFLGQHINQILKKDITNNNEYISASKRNGLDLRELNKTKEFLNSHQPNIIVHCAADVGNLNYVYENAGDVFYNNVLMYLNLYKAISDLNLNTTVINTISNCTYPGSSGIQDEKEWWNGPIHDTVISYGGAKKTGFLISECNRIQNNIKTLNLIIPNAYGPYDHLNDERTHAMNGMVLRMIKTKRNAEKSFSVWGTGSPIREWIYMGDTARVIKILIDKIVNKDTTINELPNPLNIGQENGISIKDTAKLIASKLNGDFELFFDATKKDGAPKKVLKGDNFKKHFPNFEFTPYDVGLKETITWYENNLK